ncbi:hypothetical protein DSO57_1025385 [Entomophthora muscae]|uniref:Uncharacterized protein n=1 Tax=Entomophthora muscae TaxID=34485 RepID=A0ACC2S4A1_9FUNG|nr:hypothetical protein DSO57_1025385 [Entomophthora muscae]
MSCPAPVFYHLPKVPEGSTTPSSPPSAPSAPGVLPAITCLFTGYPPDPAGVRSTPKETLAAGPLVRAGDPEVSRHLGLGGQPGSSGVGKVIGACLVPLSLPSPWLREALVAATPTQPFEGDL